MSDTSGLLRGVRSMLALYFLGAVAIGVWFWWRQPAPALSPVLEHRLDSLERTAPAFDSAVARQLADDRRRDAVERRLVAIATAATVRADSQRARADSLALAATLGTNDGASWRAAHDARAAEALELRTRVAVDSARIDTLRTARDSLRYLADSILTPRLDVERATVKDLRGAVAKLTSRTVWDYVAIGCGYGIKGADCIVGARIPIGRRGRVSAPGLPIVPRPAP